MSLAAPLHLTADEYLRLEAASTVRHEYVGGVLYAMTGATLRHNLVAGAIYSALREAALAAGCRPYIEGAKLRVGPDAGPWAFYYPDVMVVCEPLTDERYETAPCLVVQVLSPSTETVDRREKLGACLSIPTLSMYLIVDPAHPRVEVHERMGERWVSSIGGSGEVVLVPCAGISIPVDDIYRDL